MKGITPVVAIILLLMITISMVGFAFVWFSRMIESVTAGAENQTISELEAMRRKVNIENAAGNSATIRNTGSINIPVNQLSFYIDNVNKACTFTVTEIAPLTAETCTLSDSCDTNEKLKVVAPGNTAIYTC